MKFLKRVSLVVIPILMLTSCASWTARKGTAQTRDYAAITDWNTAKEAALIAVANESGPINVASAIVSTMREGDNQILAIEDMRLRGVFDGDMADIALKILLEVQLKLLRLSAVAATGAHYYPPGPSYKTSLEACFV